MLLPVYGSLIPVPPVPYNRLPYIFLVYMIVGFAVWAVTARRKTSLTNTMDFQAPPMSEAEPMPAV
jgi:hypothetical protein